MRVAALFLYPVKSCAGHGVRSLRLDAHGPEGDRLWAVVDARGRALTQRTAPALALVRARERAGALTLSAPERAPLRVAAPRGGRGLEVRVESRRVRALDAGAAAARWLSAWSGKELRLARLAEPGAGRARGSFADAHPLHLVSEASLDDLSGRQGSPVPPAKFRPNIVVAGASAYAEDAWRRVRIGKVELSGAGPCDRCRMVNVEPESGRPGPGPLPALSAYRRDARGAVLFGVYLAHGGSGTLRVGDPVEALA